MEPQYKGANGRMNAMAIAWLFANDHVFFNEDEISWGGWNHGITGAQINASNLDEIPNFMKNPEKYFQGIGDFLITLERDESLMVPRSKIHPGLYRAIREGDLTGITLFNLQACGQAFRFLDEGDEEFKRNLLRTAGKEWLINEPGALDNTYVVAVDRRLTRGIPNFYQLVLQMFEDMRAYNEIDSPYVLIFAASRNLDADQYLDSFEDSVIGAVTEGVHIETNISEWELLGVVEVNRPAPVENESQCGDDCNEDEVSENEAEASEDEVDERSAMIDILRLFVLTNELGGNSEIPQELLDELDRAENGDESVDIEDLARRIHECAPEIQTADLSQVTFNEGKIAEGRRFNMKVPDGWTVVKNYEESMLFQTQVRPYVIVQGEVKPNEDLSLRDRIIYSSLLGDVEVNDTAKMCGSNVTAWAFRMNAQYDRSDDSTAAMKPVNIWDTEVDAVNTQCLITQHQMNESANGLEFDVYPYAVDHFDSLRFVFTYDENTDVEAVRSLVITMAQSIELDKPFVSESEQTLREALEGKISADDFIKMIMLLKAPLESLRQMVFTSYQYRYAIKAEDFDANECTLAGARGIAELSRKAIPTFERLMDAYDVQVKTGYTISELDGLLDALTTFDKDVFPTTDIFDYDDGRLIKEAGIFNPSDELVAVRNRLKYAKQHGGMVSLPENESTYVKAVTTPITRQLKREPRYIDESFKTEALPRLEKALNEPVDASFFIGTSEIAANALMSERQQACSSAADQYGDPADKVVAMAREMGKFNTVICRYYGYLVDALEAQVELGVSPEDIRRMAAEVNEFSELVADRFSCGDSYYDGIANSRAPITRPTEYASIRDRWQKINAR